MVLNDDIINISNFFQDGCNTIVSGCTTYGSTPSSNSPADIVEAIKNIAESNNFNGISNVRSGAWGGDQYYATKQISQFAITLENSTKYILALAGTVKGSGTNAALFKVNYFI